MSEPGLPPRTRLGPYEIGAPLGAGGMGEVYRARDTRLGREVAVKVLRGGVASTPEARARFEREARAVSALNHPHICVLYDVGRQETVAGSLDYLVMELIEGETLADRLLRGPLALDEALKAAAEIADALDRAHRKGIVHRDLKPGNIMLTRSGTKLLDFGLARPAGPGEPGSDLSRSPTMTRGLTAEGTLVGTFQYMAPEQLEGKEADARTDLFAFGATLYEMSTGRKAFEGSSQASLITAIMTAKPEPMTAHQPLTPPALERVVSVCLARDPDDRWQCARDLKRELQWIASGTAETPAPRAARGAAPRLAWALALVLPLLSAAAVALWMPHGAPTSEEILRAAIPAPPNARFNIVGDVAGPPVLSPDGRQVIFAAIDNAGASRIWVRPLDSLSARPLPGTEGGMYPFWSPDGRSLGYFTGGKLRRIDVEGGAPFTICDATSSRGGAWAPDGTIIFPMTFASALVRVSSGGGTPAPLTRLDASKHSTHRWPQFLPDGRHFIFLAAHHEQLHDADSGIYLGSLDGSEPRRLVRASSGAVYAAGYLLYVQGDGLVAQPFDAASGQVTGPAVPTPERVQLDKTTWRGVFSASMSGLLIYMPVVERSGSNLLWYDRTGHVVESTGESGSHLNLDLSPDGRRVVVEWQEGPRSDLWVYDQEQKTRTRLTFDPMDESSPFWSPADGRIVFGSNRPDGRYRLYRKAATGGSEEMLLDWDQDVYPSDVSADGRYVLFIKGRFADRAVTDLYILPLSGKREPYPLLATEAEETDGQFSPDGRWVAYTSTQSGQEEVYVMPFTAPPAPGGEGAPAVAPERWQVSSGGGSAPRWRRDGREIYYRRADNSTMVAVEVEGRGTAFIIGQAHDLFRAYQRWDSVSYDVTADGQRFILSSLGTEGTLPLALVRNWPAVIR